MSSAEVNSHFGLLGLGVAPRFLQKVRARPEILRNKLGLLPRREAAEAALKGAEGDARPEPLRGGAKALTYLSKFRGGP